MLRSNPEHGGERDPSNYFSASPNIPEILVDFFGTRIIEVRPFGM